MPDVFVPEPFGPLYPALGAGVAKWRRRSGLTKEERREYGRAVHEAILSLQRQELQSRKGKDVATKCASGTRHTTGEKIHAAIRLQQRNALYAAVDQERRERLPKVWREMYAAAMAEKVC
ncbi:MAG: hypothetical protein HXX10_07520 [Rhodoplanes sp.]|uniref:hypothetical protein n=1 Tax=Rhodoplanes sp. TaxID=1968906 RepID=UPI0017BB81A2|nr:hypothetical protein [Rhodoplanes sp.]NVO13869.1 hypothetical protein [Rhodoplanes sp.]